MPRKGKKAVRKKKKRRKEARKPKARKAKKVVKAKIQKKVKKVGVPKEVQKLLPLEAPPGFKLAFGTAGRPLAYKGSVEEAPIFIRGELYLDAYEVQQVRRISLDEERAKILGRIAIENNVVLSVHAPYAVNLLSPEEEKIRASIDRLLQTARIAEWCGAGTIVFHPGYYGNLEPSKAIELVISNLQPLIDRVREEKLRVGIGLETMGKKSQFGTVDELIEVVKVYPETRIIFDVAHIHAREGGILRTYEDYDKIFARVESELGSKHIRHLHIHFTEVEYGERGEIKHLVLGSGSGPALDPLLEWLIDNDVKATIISESPILEVDAIRMKHRAITIFREKK